MKRRFFNVLAAVSLILCVAIIVLWVRSYWVDDSWKCQTLDAPKSRWTEYELSSDFGAIYALYFPIQFSMPADATDRLQSGADEAPGYYHIARPSHPADYDNFSASFWNRRGFVLRFEQHANVRVSNPSTYRMDRALVPDWFIVLILLLLSLPGMIQIRRDRLRRRAGLCFACGYDLRATPDRCPECGEISKKSG
jgi:hypothetical protein